MKTYANECIHESNDTLEMTELAEDNQPGTFVIAEYDFLVKNGSTKTLRLVTFTCFYSPSALQEPEPQKH